MIRWILGILLVIVLILAIVFIFRRFSTGSDDEISVDIPGEVANNGDAASQIPNVVGDSLATSAGQPVQGNVLANDTDPQNEDLTVTTQPVNSPTNGTLQLDADGSFVYTPNAGYVGADSFTYEVCDASGNCATGMVQITVNSATEAGSTDGAEGTGATEPSDTGGSEGEGTTDTQPADSSGSDGDMTEGSTQPSDSSDSGSDNTGTGGAGEDGGTSADAGSSADNTNAADSGSVPSDVSGQPIGDSVTHEVKQGEWLIQIARCYGTSPETIVSQNHIPYPGWIMPGEELTISGIGSVSDPFMEPCIMFHTVVQEETLYSISQDYEVPLDMLLKANYGCYGYGYYYLPTPDDGDGEDNGDEEENESAWYMHPKYMYGPGYGAHSPYIYTGCYAPYYNPTIYVGQELVIPVNLDNADMRP